MLRGGSRRIEVSERLCATPVGGIAVLHRMVQSLGFDREINEPLTVLKRHLPYHESDHVLSLAYNVVAGGTSLDDLDRLREDESFLDLVGAERIPDPTTAGDFLRRLVPSDVERVLDVVNITREKVWTKLPRRDRERAIVDADGTFVETTGQKKRGMEINYQGIWGYHPLIISLANTQEPLFVVNRPGNVPSHQDATVWFDRAIELCWEKFDEVLLRGDTDFSLTKNFDRWTEAGVKFVFGYDARSTLIERAEALDPEAWTELERPRREPKTASRSRRENTKEAIIVEREFENVRLLKESVAEIAYQPTHCGRAYRLVVLRKDLSVEKGQERLYPAVKYFFYIANDDRMSAQEIVAHANARCDQENLIEQLKNGIGALRVPVHDLVSNWAYMLIASLAWTLEAWFGLIQPNEQDRWAIVRMEFRRFLNSIRPHRVPSRPHGETGSHPDPDVQPVRSIDAPRRLAALPRGTLTAGRLGRGMRGGNSRPKNVYQEQRIGQRAWILHHNGNRTPDREHPTPPSGGDPNALVLGLVVCINLMPAYPERPFLGEPCRECLSR
jgi:hypothetical protein